MIFVNYMRMYIGSIIVFLFYYCMCSGKVYIRFIEFFFNILLLLTLSGLFFLLLVLFVR